MTRSVARTSSSSENRGAAPCAAGADPSVPRSSARPIGRPATTSARTLGSGRNLEVNGGRTL